MILLRWDIKSERGENEEERGLNRVTCSCRTFALFAQQRHRGNAAAAVVLTELSLRRCGQDQSMKRCTVTRILLKKALLRDRWTLDLQAGPCW
jgi:hypothetical protein